ncbi:TPA: serine hydrolase, partial [Escherichia coli]|nr:serine hydrolase [Escherichia coli]
MCRAQYQTPEKAAARLSQGYITAYGSALPWSNLEQMFAGAGGVISTAADMGKWLSMHTNEGKNINGERLLWKVRTSSDMRSSYSSGAHP